MNKFLKVFIITFVVIVILISVVCVFYIKFDNNTNQIQIEKIVSKTDYDNDGINDSEDILIGARKDVQNKPKYKSGYYQGGYPPDTEGVCTDVIWRALKEAGYNIKEMVDEDIKNNISDYPRVNGSPDPNIDFRRVPNLNIYFSKYAKTLTNELKENDIENLKEWQGGDIVVFKGGSIPDHIGIISDKRNSRGVPYIIHNCSPYTREADELMYWNNYIGKIVGHYRLSE